MHGTEPPRCSSHAGRNQGAGAPPGNQNAKKHGFYSGQFTLDELASLIEHANKTNLIDEIALVRVMTGRLQTYLSDPSTPIEEFLPAFRQLTVATGRIAQLLRTQQSLEDSETDPFLRNLHTALDELSLVLNLEL